MTLHKSACPLDCPDACSLEVSVENDKVTRIEGTHENPLTRGYICGKVRRFADHLYSPERLLHPAVRDGRKGEGHFRQVSWEDALALAAGKMREARDRWGGESILPFSYGGSNGLLSQDTTDARLWFRLGASRLARTICSAPTRLAAEGLYGRMPGVALDDYIHSRLIVLWGANPSASGIHLVPIIQEAIRKGSKLVIVDPRRTPLAPLAHLHLALRPGTDLPLALGLIRRLFEMGAADLSFLEKHATGVEQLRQRAESWTLATVESETGVDARSVEELAKLYAETSPAVIRCGWGQERNRNGGSASAAILALPAVAGKFGVRGGGYTLSNSAAYKLDSLAAAREAAPATRVVNMNLLGETLHERERPVKVLFVYNANPLTTAPSQEKVRSGLEREDLFTIVFEQVLTDTALYADLLFPATTFLERRETSRGYGAMVLQDAEAVIPPVGEARSNHEVFADLCRRLELSRTGEPETAQEIRDAILAAHPGGDSYREALDAGRIATPPTGYTPIPFVDFLPWTPDGKVHLFPEELDRAATRGLYHYQPDPATPGLPLALISPSTGKTVSSTFGQLWKTEVFLEMHPEDARARGIADGDRVRVANQLGEVRIRVRCTDAAVRKGVVVLPKGIWSRHTLNGSTSNALVPDSLTDLGGGACFNDARVEVERLA